MKTLKSILALYGLMQWICIYHLFAQMFAKQIDLKVVATATIVYLLLEISGVVDKIFFKELYEEK